MSAARRTGQGGTRREGAPGAADRARRMHPAKRLVLGVVGGLLLLVGLALLVLPGPGMLLVLAGLVLLSRAVPAVARFEEPVRVRAMQGVEASVASPWRIAGTALAGLALIGAGVVWGARLVPRLPFGGWSTGSSLILSGLVLLGLLAWSYRRTHRA
ncbi:PGPGW domain-containing protein [Actinacidiphila reveromycinica]|nr:PGPGW domain-containing protein [Streptomyces sp. SN-593]